MKSPELFDEPALSLSKNGYKVIHRGGCPTVEYERKEDAYAAYIALCAEPEIVLQSA
jgi:hypothetical protein